MWTFLDCNQSPGTHAAENDPDSKQAGANYSNDVS